MNGRLLKLQEEGFTLIEAVITVGVSCVAILALSQVMVIGLTGTAKTHGAIAFQSFMSQIRIDMMSQAACTASFKNKIPVKLAVGQNPGDSGTSNPGSTATVVYLPDGVTAIQAPSSVSNVAFKLYDFGPIDVLPQTSVIHVIGINISGTQGSGTAGSPQPVSGTVYTHAIFAGTTITACSDGNAEYQTQRAVPAVAASGSVSGTWIIERGGDTGVPVSPRTGTLEVAFGNGTMVPGSSVANPFGVITPGGGDFFVVYTDTTWFGNAYKVW